MKRLAVTLLAALTLGLPSSAAAMYIGDGGGGGSGTVCVLGIVGDGVISGTLPYSANSLTQLTTTITNQNYVGFVGSVDIWTTSASNVHRDLWLAPTYLPGHSVTIVGPTYQTGWTNPQVPYNVWIHAYSDAVGLSYKVCA